MDTIYRGGEKVKEYRRTRAISTRLDQIEEQRLVLLAKERSWTVSHMIKHIISEYCKDIFKTGSAEYKE